MQTHKGLQAIDISCLRQQKCLFVDLSFQLTPGDILLIEGPNGSGKSSLLRLLSGLATPFNGEILWQGQPIQQIQTEYRKQLHYISHHHGIKLGLTIHENLRLTKMLHDGEDDPIQLEKILTLFQLISHQHTPAHYLSAGQKRKLALARLLLFPKPIWILDEPLTALDSAMQQLFLTQLESHAQQGGIALVSSHHPISFKNANVTSLRLAT